MSMYRSKALPSQEVLAQLACENPQAFEALRSELIENCISSAPARIQPRLRGIQFRVDCIRRLSRSPLGALIKIQALMWESFLRMDHELQSFARQPSGAPPISGERMDLNYRSAQSALIIEFQPRLPTKTG